MHCCYALVLCIGVNALVLCTGVIYWNYALVYCTGAIYWSYTLVLVHWCYILELCTGVVHWLWHLGKQRSSILFLSLPPPRVVQGAESHFCFLSRSFVFFSFLDPVQAYKSLLKEGHVGVPFLHWTDPAY